MLSSVTILKNQSRILTKTETRGESLLSVGCRLRKHSCEVVSNVTSPLFIAAPYSNFKHLDPSALRKISMKVENTCSDPPLVAPLLWDSGAGSSGGSAGCSSASWTTSPPGMLCSKCNALVSFCWVKLMLVQPIWHQTGISCGVIFALMCFVIMTHQNKKWYDLWIQEIISYFAQNGRGPGRRWLGILKFKFKTWARGKLIHDCTEATKEQKLKCYIISVTSQICCRIIFGVRYFHVTEILQFSALKAVS